MERWHNAMSNVINAIKAAKAEMRKKFWEEHVRYREGNTVAVRNLESLIRECAEEVPTPTLIKLTDGTVMKSRSSAPLLSTLCQHINPIMARGMSKPIIWPPTTIGCVTLPDAED